MQSVKLEGLEKLDFRSDESYKTLRTNIELSGDDIKVLVFTSCIPNEGKSSVTMNLAISMAQAGKKVILIDADLRKSVLVGRTKVRKVTKGFTHYLSGRCTFDEVVYSTDISNFYMVFAGPVPPNPAELLGNKYFQVMIQALKNVYDYIIIDSPPLGSVIDSAIIAQECDAAVMVITANEISYKFAEKVKLQLDKTGCRVLGAVLNKVDMRPNGYYGRYYGKYYGKYYGNYYNNN